MGATCMAMSPTVARVIQKENFMTPHICLVSLQGKPRLSRYRTPYASRCPASLFHTGNGRRKRSYLLGPLCRLRHRRSTPGTTGRSHACRLPRRPVSVDDTIDCALNALDKLFGVFSDHDAESERLNARKRQLRADLEQVQRELDRVESFRSERDIVAHIDQLRRKVKRNAREDDMNAPEPKRKNAAGSEFPTLRESVPTKPCTPERLAGIPLPPPIASPKKSRPAPPPASPHARSPAPTKAPIADNAQERPISIGSDEEPSHQSRPRQRRPRHTPPPPSTTMVPAVTTANAFSLLADDSPEPDPNLLDTEEMEA